MSAIKPFTIPTDRELAQEIFEGGGAVIKHRFSDQYSEAVTEAVREIIREYDDMNDELAIISESKLIEQMERHIDKLEAMLDRRKARYKKWEDVEYDLYR